MQAKEAVRISFVFWFLLLLLAGFRAEADVTVTSSRIDQDTVWSFEDGPNFFVKNTVFVRVGVTLKIEPGVHVKFDSGTGLRVAGTLIANGRGDNKIFFEPNTSSPSKGFWEGITFFPSAKRSVLNQCNIFYGGNGADLGGFPARGNVTIASTDTTVSNCQIEKSAYDGIYIVNGSSPAVSGNSITANNSAAVRIADLQSSPSFSGNVASNNGGNGIWLDAGGTITQKMGDRTFYADLPYFFSSWVTIGPGVTVTIEPGAVLKFEDDRSLTVLGKLIALGTSSAKIGFTEKRDDSLGGDTNATTDPPAKGRWRGLIIQDGGQAVLENCVIRYGGNGTWDGVAYHFGNLEFRRAGTSTVKSCEISQSAYYNVWIIDSSPILVNNTIQTARWGLVIEGNSYLNVGPTPPISNNTITGHTDPDPNSTGAIYVSAQGASAIGGDNHIKTNKRNVVYIYESIVTGRSIWRKIVDINVAYLCDTVSVAPGAILTIEPGTIIKLRDDRGFYVEGTLIADGGTSRIVFTSSRDDTQAGDSNGDGNASAPGRGDWRSLFFRDLAQGCLLRNVLVSYGGNGAWDGSIYHSGLVIVLDRAQVQILSSELRNSRGDGVRCLGSGSPEVKSCLITNNAGSALSVTDIRGNPRVGGNTATNNGVNGIWLEGGAINQDRTWFADLPYFIGNTIEVSRATLTVSPGTAVKFEDDRALYIGTGARIIAEGTDLQPIYFTGKRDDVVNDTNNDQSGSAPSSGNWRGVFLVSGGQGRFINVIFRYGGNGSWDGGRYSYGNVTLENSGDASFEKCEFTQSKSYGLWVQGSSPKIRSCLFQGNAWGLVIEGNAYPFPYDPANLLIAGNTFRENTNGAISTPAQSAGQISGDNVIDANSRNILQVFGAVQNTSRFRYFPNNGQVAWYVVDHITVNEDALLEIEPNVVVKFENDRGLYVYGTLRAEGTATNPILFTSFKDDGNPAGDSNNDAANSTPRRGDWRSFFFGSSSQGNRLKYCEFRYGASGSWDGARSHYGEVLVEGCRDLSLLFCTLKESQYDGLRLRGGAKVTARSNFFTNNSGSPIRLEYISDDVVVSGNTATNNGFNGIILDGGDGMVLTEETGTRVWYKDLPYFVGVGIYIGPFARLEIRPGAIIKFNQSRWLVVQPKGTLIARGTDADRIYFTDVRDDSVGGDTNADGANSAPAPGWWNSLWIESDDGNSVLSFCTLRYGGGGGWAGDRGYGGRYHYGNLVVAGSSSPVLEYIATTQSANDGLRLWDTAAPQVRNCDFLNNGNWGVVADHASSLNARSLIMVGNTNGGIYVGQFANAVVNYSDTFGNGVVGGVNYQKVPSDPSATVPGTGNIIADPLFVSFPSDLRLQLNSPCKDAGDPTTTDPGTSDRADIGAFGALLAVASSATIAPQNPTVSILGTLTFTGTAKKQDGSPISGAIFSWEVLPGTGDGKIDGFGRFTPLKEGTVTVRGFYGSASAQTSVTITRTAQVLQIFPSPAAALPGQPLFFNAILLDETGQPVTPSDPIQFTSGSNLIASLGANLFVGTGVGQGSVQASLGGLTANSTVILPSNTQNGLIGRYYLGAFNWQKFPLMSRVDNNIYFGKFGTDNAFTWNPFAPSAPIPQFSVQWDGYLQLTDSGEYVLILAADDGAAVWIDGQLILDVNLLKSGGPLKKSVPVNLSAGIHSLRVRYTQRIGALAGIDFTWVTPNSTAGEVPIPFANLFVSRGDIASVETNPLTLTLGQGEVVEVQGIAKNSNGQPLSNIAFNWFPLVGQNLIFLEDNGPSARITALQPGQAKVRLTAGDKFYDLTINIQTISLPQPVIPFKVEVLPLSAVIPLNGSQTFTVVAKTSDGTVIPGPYNVNWSLEKVTGDGNLTASADSQSVTFTGTLGGEVKVIANIGGVVGIATVTIRPNPINILSGPFAVLISRTSALMEWITDIPSDSKVEYWRGSDQSTKQVKTDPALVNLHRVLLENLEPGTVYSFRVTSVGAVNETVTSSEQTFQTLPVLASRTLSIPTHLSGPTNTVVEVPINIDDASGVAGFQTDLLFNPGILSPEGVVKGSLIANVADWTVDLQSVGSGRIRIIGGNTKAVPLTGGAGDLVKIRFRISPQAVTNSFTTLDFVGTILSQNRAADIPVVTQSGKLTVSLRKGDVNGDGKVDILDVMLTINAILERTTLTEQQRVSADVNGDGAVDIRDVVGTVRIALGLSPLSSSSLQSLVPVQLRLPERLEAHPGEVMRVPVYVKGGGDLAGAQWKILVDPKVVSDLQIEKGDLTSDRDWLLSVSRWNSETGETRFLVTRLSSESTGRAEGTLLLLRLQIAERAPVGYTTALNLQDLKVVDRGARELRSSAVGGTLTVVESLKGDLDGDGRITLRDVTLALRWVLSKQPRIEAQKRAGDINGDGRITLADVTQILRQSLGRR